VSCVAGRGRWGPGVGPSGLSQEPQDPGDGPGVEATRGYTRSGASRALGGIPRGVCRIPGKRL
jgi:hypothetical protein